MDSVLPFLRWSLGEGGGKGPQPGGGAARVRRMCEGLDRILSSKLEQPVQGIGWERLSSLKVSLRKLVDAGPDSADYRAVAKEIVNLGRA